MVCSCPLGALALRSPGRFRLRSATTWVLSRATWHEPQNDLQMVASYPGLEEPRRGQAVNEEWLLLVPGLGPLSERYRTC